MATLSKIAARLLIIGSAALLWTACTPQTVGVPPSLNKPIVDYPAGSRIFFRNDDAAHVITLFEDGHYRFESQDLYGGPIAAREGQWTWRTGGTHKAELTLDSDVWILTFAGHYSAVAVNTAAPGRTFAFQFERM